MRRSSVGPNGSVENRRRLATLYYYRVSNFGDGYAALLAGLPLSDVHGAVIERLLAHRNPNRAADQVGVGELLSRALVAVVEEDVGAGPVEFGGDLSRLLLEPGQNDDVHVVRCDGIRPLDAVLVVVLLDDRGHHAPRPDAVAAAEQRLLLAILIEERRAERRGVEGAEVEDVPDLDRGLEAQCAAADGTSVALARVAQVREARLVVAPRLHAAQPPSVDGRPLSRWHRWRTG